MALSDSLDWEKVVNSSILLVLDRLDLSDLYGKRFFITGGTGFFGLWLLSTLSILYCRGLSIEVTVLSRDPEAFFVRYPQFRSQPWLRLIHGNVRDFDIPKTKFDLLIHGATETSMEAHANYFKMFDDIQIGTRHVLECSKLCGVSRVLLISSGAVYGSQPSDMTHQPDDSQAACNPLHSTSAYGEGKRVMELMGAMHQEATGIDCISARCFSFCGPGLPLEGHFAIGNFIRDALCGRPIVVKGDGSAIRSYLYGADLAVWLLVLLLKGKAGKSYNVGSDHAISIKELAILVRDNLFPNGSIDIIGSSNLEKSERQNYVPEITRARELGCEPWTSLCDAINYSEQYWRHLVVR